MEMRVRMDVCICVYVCMYEGSDETVDDLEERRGGDVVRY